MLRSVRKCKKCSFLDNLRTITQERIMETGQITLFYFIYFLRSNCLYHSFLNLKILKIHFHVVALWIVLACKTPQFLEKLPIQAAHHTFPERRHPEATKNLDYVLSTRRSQMPYFYVQAPRLLDMNISPCYLNPYIKKLIHNQFHIATSWVQANMGYTT